MRLVGLLALPFVLGACDNLVGSAADVTMAPAATPASFTSRTDFTEVTFTLTNNTPTAVSFPDNMCPGFLEVLDARGDVVYSVTDIFPLVDCPAGFRTITLQQGESFSWTERWYGLVRGNDGLPAYAAPGRYRVRAWLGTRLQALGRVENRSVQVMVR